jgi:hypothetical protein
LNFRFLSLLLPLAIAYIVQAAPELSYFVAWLGSFWVYYLVFSGFLKPFPEDRGIFSQIMRPIGIPHIIFSSYMSVTSIFYFFSANGYYYLSKDPNFFPIEQEIEDLAECQRYYLTAHIFYVMGILTFMDYNLRKPYKYVLSNPSISETTVKITIVVSALSIIIRFVPGLGQVVELMSGLALVASVLGLAFAIPERKAFPILITGFIFITNYLVAFRSGWKESIIMPMILLGGFLYNSYKKLVIIGGLVFLYLFFYYIPSYNIIVRNLSWSGETSSEEAQRIAIQAILNNEVDVVANNWDFLTGRLSEIGMFVKYLDGIRSKGSFYDFEIIGQSLLSLVPRVFFQNKPITEELVMNRTRELGVVSEYSLVSAKPAFVVDSYLSFGIVGIAIFLFLFGALSSLASVKAERLFGSYTIGTCLVYLGIFKIFIRGNCFEFAFNNIFWGFVVMFAVHYLFLKLNIIKKVL